MRRLFLTAAAIGTLVIASTAASASAAFPGKNGQIAISSALASAKQYRIQTLSPAGKGVKTILSLPAESTLSEGEPAYSSDGSRIAFELDDDIYISAADGSSLVQVTSGPQTDSSPAFSPDGSKLVFARIAASGYDVFTIGVDGSGLSQLTTEKGNDRDPTWSPKGNLIAFVSTRSGSSRVWLMKPGGGYQRPLTPDYKGKDGQSQPEFAPSGNRILVSKGADLVSFRTNGTKPEVIYRKGILLSPNYSPNGARIAAIEASKKSKLYKVVVMNADGSGKKVIRAGIANIFGIDWAPLRLLKRPGL